MTVSQLDHLNLTVTDLDATTAFYERVFGFRVEERGMNAGHPWAILRSGEAMLCLYERPDRHVAGDAEATRHGLHTLNHIGLRIHDREQWEATVTREGLEFSYPSPVEWPHSTAWYVDDPSGYQIEIALWHRDRSEF